MISSTLSEAFGFQMFAQLLKGDESIAVVINHFKKRVSLSMQKGVEGSAFAGDEQRSTWCSVDGGDYRRRRQRVAHAIRKQLHAQHRARPYELLLRSLELGVADGMFPVNLS